MSHYVHLEVIDPCCNFLRVFSLCHGVSHNLCTVLTGQGGLGQLTAQI